MESTNNRLFNLPAEIQKYIYQYDYTYKNIYDNVLDELLHYDCDEFIEYFDEVYYDSDDDNYMELRSAKYGLNIMYYELNIIDAEEFIKLYETLFKKIKNFAYDEYLKWRY